MAPPKKNAIKMDLNSFLNDETFNDSWSTDEVDLNNITIPIQNMAVSNTISLDDLAQNNAKLGSGRPMGRKLDPALRKERDEYPIPDFPPFKAIINNIPWDISESGIQAWVEDGLQKEGAVLEVMAPRERDSDRLKGMAFVTLNERADLEKALTFNGTKLNDRTVYVSVAAPRKDYGGRGGFDDLDWSGARGSNFREPREAVPEPDWSNARGTNFKESRQAVPEPDWSSARGSNFKESKPRAPEPDWSSARGSNFKESKPRAPEPDWSSARGSNFKESKPRAPEPDWSNARGSGFRESKSRTETKSRGPDLDWSAARGAKFEQNTKPKTYTRANLSSQPKEEKPKVVSSAFAVLSTEDDEEDEENEVSDLEKATDQLTVEDDKTERLQSVSQK